MAGSIDEETARTLNSGRAAIGASLRTIQKHLQKVFIVFVIGLFAGIYLMREYVWPQLKADLLVSEETEVIAQTPFDVILLQVKVGLVLGILLAIPTLLFLARDELRDRGVLRRVGVARWKAAIVGLLAVLLFAGGVLYGYYLFFPITFNFLAQNATSAGLAPTYSIVLWTEFILFLALSFGLAAQLPLLMTALSYSGIVPYETFRDRWKYAVVGIFGFGAFFSPPDPFTQLLWAAPLVLLYGFSLYLAKVVVTAKRRRDRLDVRRRLREQWNALAGAAVLAGGATYVFLTAGGARVLNEAVLPLLPAVVRPAPFRPIDVAWGLPRETAVVLATSGVALAAGLVVLLVTIYRDLVTGHGVPADPGDPTAIDLSELDASGVKAAPSEAFAEMDEATAVGAARDAMEADRAEKAEAILDRFDAAQVDEASEDDKTDEGPTDDADEEANVFASTARGMAGAFTDDDSDDDLGGYYYDLRFVFNSLRSRAFRLVVVFGAVMSATFLALYSGGIGILYEDFLARLPPGVTQDEIAFRVITLHPVEALVFMVKLSVVLGAVAVVPFLLYYAWPALKRRGLAGGDRRVLAVWGGTLLVGLLAGSAAGYLYVAPEVFSWLVYDAVREGMQVSYRVSSYFWLIFLLTIGIGLLVDIPVTMVLFHVGGLVSYGTMRKGWKAVVLGLLTVAAVLTPGSVYTMLVVAIPATIAYLGGLGFLWLLTLGGRRSNTRPQVE